MDILEAGLPGLMLIQPKVFGDARGFFMESYHRKRYAEAGICANFVQDNVSYSVQGTLRGMHFQNPGGQGKLVSVLQGEVFDVAVDVRQGSPTFGQWFGVYLNEETKRQLWIPGGFAHGFVVTSQTALFSYKCDSFYSPQTEFSLLWNDPDLGIGWPFLEVGLSKKDEMGRRLRDFKADELPLYQQ